MRVVAMTEMFAAAATIVLGVAQTYIFYKMARDPAITGFEHVNEAYAKLVKRRNVAAALRGSTENLPAVREQVYVFLHMVCVFGNDLPNQWWRGLGGSRCNALLALLDPADPASSALRERFTTCRSRAQPLRARFKGALSSVVCHGTKCLGRISQRF